ncbi:MAG: CBS domain-containing protein [Rhizobiaceae bacterium]|nr:CBS domain-containing protein [Rhizobiaceae bacterium]
MRIDRLSSTTSSRLMVVAADATLQAVALSLSNPGTGLVIVRNGDGKAVGVLSKSDLIRHLTESDVREGSVATLMSTDIIACSPEDELGAVWETMVMRRLQNMPVLAADKTPLGILDIRDAMRALLEQEELQEHMLTDYITGVGYQ